MRKPSLTSGHDLGILFAYNATLILVMEQGEI